ncbi:uncharacterized protein LOC124124203 isoform X3 [Haliotis rufescens]|uniref:uncharacterized protein LOC124124203 isoform X3 n=1 Tax=Haliotis rufescens TaxID=6454 RepID=UPI00201EDEB5|nr:uncharacterized protein LOC124124203 isoform X3 [Haliotis rufescens]
MPYQNSVTSFTSREVLDILHHPDWSRVIREPPVKPRAGEVFLFHYKDDSRKDDWRCDQYHFQHDGIRKQPRADPKFYKNFFVLRTNRGKDKRFRKHAYVLMRDHNNLVLFQYLGNESVAVDLPHGNSKDASNLYTRLCPSVIQAIKDITIKPRDILQHLQDQAQTSAVSKVKTPRSLSQISNTRCREKGRPKKVKEKRRKKKKKRVCQEVEQDNPTAASNNLTQEHLVSSNHGTEGDIPPATDVMSPQSRLNELAELCETIYQENMAGQPNRVDSCDDRMCINEGNVSGTESQTCSSMQSAQSNTGHVYSGSTQQSSQDPATTSVMEIENADCVLPANNVNIDVPNLSNVVEMEAPQNICLIIQDGGVSSSGTVECDGVTDSVERQTLDNIAETGVMDVDVHASGSNGDTLQPLKVSSVAETTHGSMECFFETQNTGQLTDVIALMKETLKTEVEFENKELTSLSSSESACSQTLPVIYIGKSTSQDKTPLPETAVSLIAQVSRLWARVFQGARQLILKSDSPGRDTLNNVSLIEALAAVVVGAYETKSDCLAFLETLKVYPCHLLRTWIEKRATDVNPDARYRIGNYTISGRDILRLEGTSWLDDSVIHAYLYLVQKQHSDARTRDVRIMECFHYKLWERQHYSEWLQEKIQLRKCDLVLMPICINSHWVLLVANVLDRTVCVINSKPSKDLETEVTQHWMKYMEYRSQAVEEELRSWKLVQRPVFPQTDGSSCGVFVLMAAEALAAGVAPGVMRNCHVAGYRQYVKQRLMLAAETTRAVEAPAGAAGENADPEMLMGVSQAEDQAQTSTDVSGREPPEMLMGVSQAEDQAQTSTDVSGREPPIMDCEMNEDENVKSSEEMPCVSLSRGQNVDPSVGELDHAPLDATGLDKVGKTEDRNVSVDSSIQSVDETEAGEEDMKVVTADNNAQDQSGPMELGTYVDDSTMSCEHPLDHVPLQSQCEALFENQKSNFTALTLLCLEKGKLMLSDLDGPAEDCSLQMHMKWACQLTRTDEMSGEQFRQCLYSLSGSLLRPQGSVVQLRHEQTQSHIEEILMTTAVEYINDVDLLFIYRHVKVQGSRDSLSNGKGLTLYLDKNRQKDLGLRFVGEIEKRNFAFTLTHQACGKHTFASMLIRMCTATGNVKELFKICDKIHGGNFLSWMCFGKNAELYKVLSSYIPEEERKECVIPCCVSGNSEILQLLLEDMELDGLLSSTPRLQVVHGIDSCQGQPESLPSHHLPPLHLASYYGHTDIVQLLLQYGYDVNLQLQPQGDEAGQVAARSTPAAVAAQRGHTGVLKCLMESNADLNLVDCKLNTPLHLACEAGHGGIVLILANVCKICSRNKNGNTPVHLACQEGRADVVDILLNRNADLTMLNFNNCSPIDVVCSNGYSSVLQLLLNRISYPLPCDGYKTPLHTACKNGYPEIVNILLQHDAGRSVCADRNTPLEMAVGNNRTNIVSALLRSGTNNNINTQIFNSASKEGHTDIVKLLIEKGADVSAAGCGDTPLLCACRGGHTDIVKLLIEKGADVSAAAAAGYTPLSCACRGGHTDIVKLLIEKGADVSAAFNYDDDDDDDDDGYTPLSWACKNGHTDIVKLLIEKGADVSAAGCGDTPLLCACRGGHTDIVKLLIEKGADVSAADDDGDTPLPCACREGHTDIVKLLIEKGADVSAAFNYDDDDDDDDGYTPLSWACKNGHTDIVKLLIEKGADVSAAGCGDTPLLCACRGGHTDIVKLLIEKGADVSAAAAAGYTPLSCACRGGHTDIVKLLIEKGADVSAAFNYDDDDDDDDDGYTPLSWACKNGHTDIVKLLIEKGADVYAAADDGDTPLSCACRGGHTDIVKLLIEKGADVYAAGGRGGDTPLSCACRGGHNDIVKLLIEKGADVSAGGGRGGDTPLSCACRGGHTDIVKLLIEKGADVSAGGGRGGDTPLSCACRGGHTDIVKLLIEKGADVSAGGGRGGDTPLSWACWGCHTDIVKLLIEKGADVSAGGGRGGDTPLSCACRGGHTDIVKLLIEKGADVSAGGGRGGDTPLSCACRGCHTDIVKLLIEKGADVSAAADYGDTPLSCACRGGHTDIVKLLIEKGADVSAAAGYGDTPQSCACSEGHTDTVKLLIEKGADVSAAADYGDTPLSWACRGGHTDIVKLLIEKGADVSAAAAAGYTPLLWACRGGHTDIVKLFNDRLNISLGCFHSILKKVSTEGKREVASVVLKEVLSRHYCPTLNEWCSYSDYLDIVKDICDKSDVETFPGMLITSLLEKAVANGDACGVELLTEYMTGVVSNYCLLSLMLKAIENRHIAVFQILHSIPHVHDSCDNLVQKACHYGLVQVCNVLLRCGCTHSGTCLTEALKVKNVVLVELLLSHGVDVNARDDDGNTSLHLACEVGEWSLVEIFIAKGIDVSQTNKRLETPLFTACRYGYVNIAKLLLSHGADITKQDIIGNTVLHSVSMPGHEVLLQLSLHYIWMKTDNGYHDQEQERFLNCKCVRDILHCRNNNGETPLHIACREKCTGVLKSLLQYKASVFVTDNDGHTPVYHAVKLKTLFRVLCTVTRDINGMDSDGNTILHMACMKGDVESVDILCGRGASVLACNKNQECALHKSAENGNEDIMNILLAQQADVNMTDTDKQTPLHIACAEGHLKIVELLVKSKVDVNVPDKHLLVPLHLACRDGQRNIADALIKSSADIAPCSEKRDTPLSYACEGGHIGCVALLLQNGACANVAGYRGNTPLHKACVGGHEHVVRLLLSCGADPMKENNNGKLPLHHAVLWGNLAIVNILLHKAKQYLDKTDNIVSLLEWACSRKHDLVKKYTDFLSVNSMSSPSMVSTVINAKHSELLPVLADNGLNTKLKDELGRNALQILCEMEDCDMDTLKTVLDLEFDLSETTEQGGTMLHKTDNIVSLLKRACSRGHDEIVKRLIDFIPDNSMSSPSMVSLVATAISAKHSELLPVLADNGLNIKLKDEFGRNALQILCEMEDCETDTLEKVSDLGFDLLETTEQGGTMLHVVSKVGNIELVDYLIGKGIHVQAKDKGGDTALHAACAHGHFEMAKGLIKKGLSINEKNMRAMSPLDLAIVSKHYGVTCLYDLWCEISKSRPRISMTSLHHICRDNKIQLLSNSEVMFAEKDSDGNSALHIACIEESEEIVQPLIKAGAWLLVVDTHGDAPVHVACRGSSPCLKAMMDAILNRDVLAQVLSLRDKNGNVPLHIVTFEQNLQKVCILLDKHVDVEIVNNFDQTALHIACYGGNADIVAQLLGAGASILAVDKGGNTPLHIVCKEGNLPLLMLINNSDAAITAKNYEGRTPLHEAVNHEHYDMTCYMMIAYCHFPTRDLSVLRLQQFIKQIGGEDFIRLIMAEKIDVDPYGNTPLHFAAETGSLDFVNTLIRRGYNCDSRNRQGRTPLFHACSSGSTNIAKLILQRGSSSSVSDSNNMTPLHTASERGHVDVVKLLLEYDHNLQAKTNEGQTALHLSCLAGQKDVTEVLLKAGSDMNALDNGLETPLHLAARSGAGDVMVLQAKWGARDTQCNVHGNTALHIACGEGHADAVKALLNMGSDILATNKLEKTPLMLACERQHGSILELLLRRSWVQIQVQCLQDKNQGDLRKKMYVNNLNHCLCVACKYNYLNTVKVLLKYDVNINHGSNITRDMPEGSCTSRTDRGQMETESGGQLQTPLHISCYEGHAECVALLIQARALLEARIASGDTPLHVACEQGKEGPLELLIANGASPSPVNANNSTPLHYACQGGYEGIVWRLLEAGADLDIRDVHGKSPLEVCSSQGVKDVILKRCGRKRRQESCQEAEATPHKLPRI